jgi:hypothetical protein
MCKKLYYCGTRIDPCLKIQIDNINNNTIFKTILSCCGHNKYPKTIVVMNKKTKEVIEFFSKVHLSQGIRKSKKYYKKDKQGFYFISELN